MLVTYFTQDKSSKSFNLEVSHHAAVRFKTRWALAFPKRKEPEDWEKELISQFARCSPILNLDKHKEVKNRIRRHGDARYFTSNVFAFVVRDNVLVTVDLCGVNRDLNKVEVPYHPDQRVLGKAAEA